MEEKVLVKSNMSFLARIKKFCYVIFGLTGICGIVTLISSSMARKYWAAYQSAGGGVSGLAGQYHDKFSSARYIQSSFSILALGLLAISVVLLVFYLYCSKMSLTITDKRIYGMTAFGRRVDLPLDMVSAVGTSAFKGIAVATSSGKIKFLGISNQEEVHKAITDLLMDRQNNPTPTTQIKQEIQQSNADELGKFKDLLDKGIITQEEFDAKKKQLLGL